MFGFWFALLFTLGGNAISLSPTISPTAPKRTQRAAIVEEHHHALVHLMNASKSGLLPKEGVTMLHLDSHGDMSLPPFFDVNTIWDDPDPNKILEYTVISNWVPAAMAMGLLTKIIFIEPPWGIEFVPRPHRSLIMTIGNYKDEFRIHVRTPDGEDVSAAYKTVIGKTGKLKKMKNKFEVEFNVVPLQNLQTAVLPLLQNDDSPLYLSVDMDVFSTESPVHLGVMRDLQLPIRVQQLIFEFWRGIYEPQDFHYWTTQLHEDHCPLLYTNVSRQIEHPAVQAQEDAHPEGPNAPLLQPLKFDYDDDLPEDDFLTALVSQLTQMTAPNKEKSREFIHQALLPYASHLQQLTQRIGAEALMLQLHRVVFYPLHISSDPSSQLLLNALQCLLQLLKDEGSVPAMITLSRSPMYTPLHQLQLMECTLLSMITKLYPALRNLDYDEGVSLRVTACREYTQFSLKRVSKFNGKYMERFYPAEIIELVVSNSATESVQVLIQREAQIMQAGSVEPGKQTSFRIPSNENVGIFVRNKYLVDGPRRTEMRDGHTLFWSISAEQVQLALVMDGVHPERDEL